MFESWTLNVEPLHTKHGDSDFHHLVSGGALGVDDVSTTMVQHALRDHDHRGRVGGVDLKGNTSQKSQILIQTKQQLTGPDSHC